MTCKYCKGSGSNRAQHGRVKCPDCNGTGCIDETKDCVDCVHFRDEDDDFCVKNCKNQDKFERG